MSISAPNNSVPGLERLEPAFFEELFEGAGLPISVCDLRGRILAVNSLAEKLVRNAPKRPETLHDLLAAEDRAQLDESLAALARLREPLEFRSRLIGADGEPTEYAVWLTPTSDATGALAHVTVWFHDITARLQLRRSMRKKEKLTALGVLSGSVAHHYNNLLCCIATSLEYAMNMNTMSAMRRSLRRTTEAVARATELTQQLLAFAQADHRTVDRADLTETVLYFYDEQEPRFSERKISCHLRWEPIPVLALPREQLMLVLSHLTNNAIEAMPDGGELTVALARRNHDHVALTISDTGAGIAPQHMERLFEPFFTTRGELAEGTTRKSGMGLAVVHGLVNEMHGTISVAANPGGGARFEIILPLASEDFGD